MLRIRHVGMGNFFQFRVHLQFVVQQQQLKEFLNVEYSPDPRSGKGKPSFHQELTIKLTVFGKCVNIVECWILSKPP